MAQAPHPQPSVLLHATAVAWDGRAALFLGGSGTGKSALALQLMAAGADLVADDQTLITRSGPDLVASCPAPLSGLIEARGVGILRAEPCTEARVQLLVDLDQEEVERLPQKRNRELLGVSIELVFHSPTRHFPYAILQYLKAGRGN